MPTVIIPPPYQGPTRGVGRVDVAGETPSDCLDALEKAYPGFRAQVIDGEGRVHRFVKLFVNRELLAPSALGTSRLAEDDELEIVAAIAGG